MKLITSAEFDSEVLASKGPVVVDFFTEDCSPCRAMAPILQEWEAEAVGAFKVVKVDAVAEADLAATHQVRAVPSFFLFSNGKCLAQTTGLKSEGSMKKWFDESFKAQA